MSHNYTCNFCNKPSACELTSIQHLTPCGRVGFDLYECTNCGIRYITKDGGYCQPTKKSYKTLAKIVGNAALDRYEHPEKYKQEKKQYEENQKREWNSPASKKFRKIFNKAIKEGKKRKVKKK